MLEWYKMISVNIYKVTKFQKNWLSKVKTII